MLRMLRISSMLLIILVLVIGCSYGDRVVKKDVTIISAENPPRIVIGSKFFYNRVNSITGKSSLSFTRIKSKVNWMGIPAYVVEASRQDETTKEFVTYAYTIMDSNLNPLAIMDSKGNLSLVTVGKATIVTAQGNMVIPPAVTIYNWPLRVGKSFSTNYELLSKTDGKTYHISDQVKVEDRTLLSSKLASLIAYKIYRTTPGTIEIRYYSPELGTDVKQEITNTLENPSGVGAFVIEMVGYSIPGVGNKGEKF